jgi:hypothetical protein
VSGSRVLMILASLTVALALPSPALAQAAVTTVTITGPGLAEPLVLRGQSADELLFETGALESGCPSLSALLFPPVHLGPRYRAAYTLVFGPGNEDRIDQNLFPYAKGGPVVRAGKTRSSLPSSLPPPGYWRKAGEGALSVLREHGLPKKPPAGTTPVPDAPKPAPTRVARASIEGPGLDRPLLLVGEAAAPLSRTGILGAKCLTLSAFGISSPALGPRYEVRILLDGADAEVRQQLYPFAEVGPLTSTPALQPNPLEPSGGQLIEGGCSGCPPALLTLWSRRGCRRRPSSRTPAPPRWRVGPFRRKGREVQSFPRGP